MWWRDRSLGHGTPKKRAMGALVGAGREPGLLAYDDGDPVGWISVAPREEFRVLTRSPQYRPRDDDDGVWSIVCITVDRPAQRQGVAADLVDAACAHAFDRGASAVEAYPHVSNGSDYMGSVPLFERAGFVHVRDANKRAVYRRLP